MPGILWNLEIQAKKPDAENEPENIERSRYDKLQPGVIAPQILKPVPKMCGNKTGRQQHIAEIVPLKALLGDRKNKRRQQQVQRTKNKKDREQNILITPDEAFPGIKIHQKHIGIGQKVFGNGKIDLAGIARSEPERKHEIAALDGPSLKRETGAGGKYRVDTAIAANLVTRKFRNKRIDYFRHKNLAVFRVVDHFKPRPQSFVFVAENEFHILPGLESALLYLFNCQDIIGVFQHFELRIQDSKSGIAQQQRCGLGAKDRCLQHDTNNQKYYLLHPMQTKLQALNPYLRQICKNHGFPGAMPHHLPPEP